MISNSNQITKPLKLLKYIVIDDVVREFDSFIVSNFKFHKFHTFLFYNLNFKRKYIQVNKIDLKILRVYIRVSKNNLTLLKKYISVYKNNIRNNKFNYNLKFDGIFAPKTKKTLVISCETDHFGISTPIEFDCNLILGVYNDK